MPDIPRPQPLGAFPLPAGLLLITGEDSEPVRQSLLAGRLPAAWPEGLEAVRLAYAGDLPAAVGLFCRGAGPVDLYNQWVIDPTSANREDVALGLGEAWTPLVDYVAYTLGLSSTPPLATRADGELAALLATAQAAAALDDGEPEEAIRHLRQAVADADILHPAFQGIVFSDLAVRAQDLEAADQAVELLRDTDLRAAYAEALYHRAGLVHGLALDGQRPLDEAIRGYLEVLGLVTEDSNPGLFARAHMNLATAYLATPVTSPEDGLRAGVAVASLRTAVRLLDPAADAEEWASATVNLANALVYAPSAGQRDNIMEAVDLYETVLRVRPAESDPLGRARVLANQGNALAHLGLRDDATARLAEAQALFAAGGDAASADLVSARLTAWPAPSPRG
jgi:tetratricopeptide (TPR) repeat protein